MKKSDAYDFFYPPVLAEQIWLFQIFKHFRKQISPLFTVKNWDESFVQTCRNNRFVHLMGAKRLDAVREYIISIAKKHKLKY